MKIIAASPRVPALDAKGDQLVSFHRLKYLVERGHDIHLVCFACPDQHRYQIETLENLGIKVYPVRWSFIESIFRMVMAIFQRSMPIQCAFYKSSKFTQTVRRLQYLIEPDIFYCVLVRILPNIDVQYHPNLVLEMVDSMSLNFSRRAANSLPPLRWLLEEETRRIYHFEQGAAHNSVCGFVVSAIDHNHIGSEKVFVIGLGVDSEKFIMNRRPADNPVILFSGNMGYEANVAAVLWFARNCWPKIKKAIPSAILLVAGNNPASAIKRLAGESSGIVVTGKVPSMVDVINMATVAVAPMRTGSGMQCKILEAMACGVPVVTNRLGLGGIAAKEGREILIADEADGFAAQVIEICRNKYLNEFVGLHGLEFIKKHHSWENGNRQFEFTILENLRKSEFSTSSNNNLTH